MGRTVLYRYNPETDNYERVYLTLKDRLRGVARIGLLGLIIGIVIFLVIRFGFESPEEATRRGEIGRLEGQYALLEKRLENALRVMENIRSRDDNFYRVMMQMDPLSRGRRLAGLDNEARYRRLMGLSDAELVTQITRQMDLLDRQIYAQSLSFDQLREMAGKEQEKLARTPAVLPINVKDYTMASGYGYRRDPVYGSTRFHEGLDFAAPRGTKVFATADGVVAEAGWKNGYGNCVDIDHGYNYLTRYAHLSKIDVKVGEKVNRGQRIGEVGSTGRSTGSHLHYEVRFKDKAQNPVNYYFIDVTPEQYNEMIRLAENAGHVMD